MQTTVEAARRQPRQAARRRPRRGVRDRVNAAFRKLAARGAHPRVPARQGTPPDPRGPLRRRRRPRAGAEGRPPRLLRRRRRRRGPRRDRRRPRSRSPRARRKATSSSTPSSQVRPVVNLTGYDSLHGRARLHRRPTTRRSTRRSTGLRERFGDLEESTEPLIDGDYAEMDISGSVDGEPVDALHRDRLPLRGRLRRPSRPALDEAAAGQEARRHRRVHRRAARAVRRARRRRGRASVCS